MNIKLKILAELNHEDGINASGIAKRLDLRNGAVIASRLSELKKDEMITLSDKLYYLTEKGKKNLSEYLHITEDASKNSEPEQQQEEPETSLIEEPEPARFTDQMDWPPMEAQIMAVCADLSDFLIEKNRAYGNSVAEPVSIFAKRVDKLAQIDVRLDDKLSRLMKGHEYPGDDTVKDLAGYLILRMVVAEQNSQKHPGQH